MKPSIYIETSVISYLTARLSKDLIVAAHQQITPNIFPPTEEFSMKDDPIIQELRTMRKDIEEECNRKGQSYFNYLLEAQDKYKDRLVVEPLGYKEIMKSA